MYTIVVRSKRDRDALRAVTDTYYRGWSIRVETLKGVRSLDKAKERLMEIIREDSFTVVLLGREDRSMAKALERFLPPTCSVHVVPRARVRNARPLTIRKELEKGRAKIRLAAGWDPVDKAYVLSWHSGARLEGYSYSPAYDNFFIIGTSFKDIMDKLLNKEIGRNTLVLRKMGGEHVIYSGEKICATLHIPDHGCRPRGYVREVDAINVSLDKLLQVNNDVLRAFETVSKRFLERFRDKVDVVAVPWSGGKDSTSALLLALDVFGPKRVVAVYVDTGVDFPQNREYVENLAKKLSVRLEKVEASVRQGLVSEGLPLPTHKNRWCTARKLDALKSKLRELTGSVLVVVGDRDSESEPRSRRPPVREEEGRIVVAPLKQWSSAHVQLYLLSRGVPLNPLYELGFYRLGCYICPALRSWEVYIMACREEILRALESDPVFRTFMKSRGCAGFI